MSNKKEHFKPAVIRKLKDRVNHLCSRPTCQAQTSGPATEGKVNTVGTAAHICARSPNGPRYKASQTYEERHGFDNAIWLCNICAREIDLDPVAFTEELLREWKIGAEQRASSALGRRIQPPVDIPATLVAALTGNAPKPLHSAIHNIHLANNMAYEQIDPRFKVESEYKNGAQTLIFRARENVDLSMTVKPDFAAEFLEKQANMLEYGKGFDIPTTGISISGSPLFDTTFNAQDALLRITPTGIEARHKLILNEPSTGKIDFADDIVGTVTGGKLAFSFTGSAFDGVLVMEYVYPKEPEGIKSNITISLNYALWAGKDLAALPYINKVRSLFKSLTDGWRIETWLDTSAGTVFRADISSLLDSSFINTHYTFISYVRMCKIIAQHLGISIPFRDDIHITREAYNNLVRIVNRFENKVILGVEALASIPECTMITSLEMLSQFEPEIRLADGTMQWVHQEPETVSLLGIDVELPPLVIAISHVHLKLVEMLGVTDSDANIRVKLIPVDGFTYSETYGHQSGA